MNRVSSNLRFCLRNSSKTINSLNIGNIGSVDFNSSISSIFISPNSRLVQVRHSGSGKRRPSKSPRLNWKEKMQLGLDKPFVAFKPKPFGYVDEDLQAFRKEGDYSVKLSDSKSLKEPENKIDLNIRKVLVPGNMFGSKKSSGMIELKPAKKAFSHSRVFGALNKAKSAAATSN